MLFVSQWNELCSASHELCPLSHTLSFFSAEYTVINENCPGAEWNIMCRECCEYDQIKCVCPGQKEVVGYTIPCCRNEDNECDSCLIHPGCMIFENCKSCRNGSWGGTLDNFYIKGVYCAECRAGWYGGDCMRCGQVLQASRGQILLESYPLNAHCEWTIHAKPGFVVELRFAMLSLEFDYMCQYDYVEIRDGDSVDSRIIKRFCGNDRPPPIRSTGTSLHVLFHSDGSKNFDGFHAIFEEITGLCNTVFFLACREPKISDLVRQKVLPMQVQSRETPLHRLYSSAYNKQKLEAYPTKKPSLPFGELPSGFQHLHTQLQYDCISPFYRRLGSSRRTCLKTGKWSGRAPSCIPICGKTENITLQKPSTTRWPWQAAIYRRPNGVKAPTHRKGAWILICSGALLNERTVVVAAHCVTNLGKITVLKTADIRVVLGKHYRDDDRDEKTVQNLRISAIIVHPNYDPILLDSDIAIVKLLDKARISNRVQPICLASMRDIDPPADDLQIVITGWKILADIADPSYKNDTIRMGSVQIIDSLLCEQQYEENGLVLISISKLKSWCCPRSCGQHDCMECCYLPTRAVPIDLLTFACFRTARLAEGGANSWSSACSQIRTAILSVSKLSSSLV
uniref:Peptidase domain containing associated with muscle regeneration 1 n=1 Tax=Anolis carolinensis TaxID=28377 RepID=G1KCX7_ANOCA